MEGIITRLDDLFAKTHPGIRFTYVKSDSLAAVNSLMFDTSALAPSGIDYPSSLTYTDIVHGPPFSIRVAHGSLLPDAEVSPLVVIVNRANPVNRLTMNQVSAIFSQTRRAPVISHWSQAGIQGELANEQIHPYGLPWSDHYFSQDPDFASFFFAGKLHNAPPVERYGMLTSYAAVVRAVAADPSSIGVASAGSIDSTVKVVAISQGGFDAPMSATRSAIAGGRYPLDRYLRIYGRVVDGRPLDPLVKEYMRMVLSPQGQQIIASGPEGYIPLSALERQEELAKLP